MRAIAVKITGTTSSPKTSFAGLEFLRQASPHPAWYGAHGPLSIPSDWNGITEPPVMMTAVSGKKGAGVARAPEVVLAVVRTTDPADPLLLS